MSGCVGGVGGWCFGQQSKVPWMSCMLWGYALLLLLPLMLLRSLCWPCVIIPPTFQKDFFLPSAL